MVFQRKVTLEIDKTEPQSLGELERIPGLGPASRDSETTSSSWCELTEGTGEALDPNRSARVQPR